MNSLVILTIISALSTFLLGLIVLIRNRRDHMFISFSIFAFITSIWALSNLFFELNHSLLSLKCQYAFGSLVMVFGLLWVERLVGSNKKIKEVFYVIFGAILFAIPFIDGLVVRDVYATGGSFGFEKGAIFDIYSTIANLIFLYLIYALISGFRRSKGLKRTQLTFVITGAVLFSTISIFYSFVLPFFGFHPVAPVDAISSLFLVGFSSYAIIKHRFLDIRMVVARSVAYAILLLILGGFYGAAIFTAQALIFPSASYSTGYVALQITLALIMAFSFQPLRRWLTRVTDKIFFKNAYDPEALLDDVSHTVGSTIVLIEMMYKTLQLLSKEMKVTRGIIVVLTESGAIYNSQSINYKNALEIKDTDMVKLAKDGILIYDELEESSHYKRLLRKYDVSVSVPIKTNTDTVGVLLLGEKASGDMYSQTDHKIFEIIAPELAVAITNAKSFEKIEKFNVTLRQEIKKATHELEKKNDQLRELDKAKDEFISMASHQLRTPLTAIKGYLSMLLEGDAGEIKVSQYDFVNEAYQGANRMVGLINDLLNVSRMETGRFFLEPTEVNMEKVAEEEVKQLLNHAKEKKLKLSLKIKGKTPHVMVDETKIRQVMMNFIDNAVYYTTEGSVTVTLEHDKNDVIFKVTDTGIGVPKEAQKNLFTKFYRADNARHVRPDGTGLGIYLAKRVMDDHHGELIFHSEEGKGSVFGFKLPIKSKIKMQPVTAPAPTGQTVGPAIGELAAGIGVPAETLEATQVKCGPTVTPNSAIANGDVIASKAAGLETPLPKVK